MLRRLLGGISAVENVNTKQLPILYNRKEECCGCTACYAICPKSAITMAEDEEGFKYPQLNERKCIRCHICLKVCPIKIANSHDLMMV